MVYRIGGQAMFDRLERSSLRLVRVVYFKVIDKDKVYYLLEKSYLSKYDGRIDVTRITEKEYEKAVLKEEKTVEISYEESRLGIKNWIKELYHGQYQVP